MSERRKISQVSRMVFMAVVPFVGVVIRRPLRREASGRSGGGRRRRGSDGGGRSTTPRARPRRAAAGSAGRPSRRDPRRAGRSRPRRSPRGRTAASRTVSRTRSVGAVDAERDDVAGHLPLELVGGALGDDLAVVDDREAVGQGVGLLEVVGRQEDRRALLAEAADLVPHAGARLRVEAGRRLVEEQDRRAVDDPQADVEPALHAAGVGAGRPVGGRLEVERREHLGRAGLGVAPCSCRTGGPG